MDNASQTGLSCVYENLQIDKHDQSLKNNPDLSRNYYDVE